MSLIAGVASIGISWFKAGGAGKWYQEVGSLVNNSAVGGIVESLENETNREYPQLRALRQKCVDRWRDYQRAWPWNKASTLQTYNASVETLSNAVMVEEKASYDFLSGGLAGIAETVKKPVVLIGIVVVVILVVVILLIAKR